jgi:hypothetical protein
MNFSESVLKENLSYLKNEINCEIVKKLKRTKNPTKVFKLKISENIKNHFFEKYNLNCWYRPSNRFLEDFALITQRYMQINSYCHIEQDTFQIKLNNNRRVNYNEIENNNLIQRTIFEGPSISFKFTCGYRVELTAELREWCKNV